MADTERSRKIAQDREGRIKEQGWGPWTRVRTISNRMDRELQQALLEIRNNNFWAGPTSSGRSKQGLFVGRVQGSCHS